MNLDECFGNRSRFRRAFLYSHYIIDGKIDYPTIYEKIIDKFGFWFDDQLSKPFNKFLDADDNSFNYILNSDGPYGARYFLFHCIVNGDINSLDVLLESKTEAEKDRDFAVLLTLLQQYADLYLISKVYSNSGFWDFVGNANLLNPVFQCFHFVHYVANIKTSGKPQIIRLGDITNIYQQGNLAGEECISRTKYEIIDPLVDKLMTILKSDHFDSYFKEYFGMVYDRYNDVSEEKFKTEEKHSMYSDIYFSTKSEGKNLLYQKLKSLGIGEE